MIPKTDDALRRLRDGQRTRIRNLIDEVRVDFPDLAPPDRRPQSPQPAERDEPTGFIVVRTTTHLDDDDPSSLRDVAEANALKELQGVLDEFDLQSKPLITSARRDELRKMEAAARQSELPPLHSLTAYWRLDARHLGREIDHAVELLAQARGVETAYLQRTGTDPVVSPGDDDHNGSQDYLDAAPTGIDARWAWTQGIEGAGVGVVDMEQGWFLGHEDYTSKSPTVIVGDNRDGVGTYQGNHGTAVLGAMIADDNDRGVVGAAPAAGPVDAASHYVSGTGSGNVSDAVVAAVTHLSAGDALLIEFQTSFLPAEIVDDSFDAIRLASALGIVVFEAAGNGSSDLDDYAHPTDGSILDRASTDFRESGAIMIGAALSNTPHERKAASNFGSRIDCYAWGEDVTTCGYGDLGVSTGDNDTYTADFQNTSAATPIVAGAGLLVQSAAEATTGVRLSPLQMRSVLSDPATGTPQGTMVAGNIGVMPDIRAIIEADLGLVADVYLRDNVADAGVVPSAGSLSSSPDIIVRNAPVADPDAAFGAGSGTENSTSLGEPVATGQDNVVYARLKNRGGTAAAGVRVQLFWSEVATLVTPDMWNPIGVTDPVDVPVGDTLVVTDPVTWDEAEIPAPGHYCFVGIADHPADPAPPVPPATDWNGFMSFVRNQNNVVWRNFNVIDPAGAGDPFVADFLIVNAPDRRRVFDFVIDVRMPEDVRVELQVPPAIVESFVRGSQVEVRFDKKSGLASFTLPRAPRVFVPKVLLPAGARFASRFVVHGADQARPGNQVCIQQAYDGEAVGGITWSFDRVPD